MKADSDKPIEDLFKEIVKEIELMDPNQRAVTGNKVMLLQAMVDEVVGIKLEETGKLITAALNNLADAVRGSRPTPPLEFGGAEERS